MESICDWVWPMKGKKPAGVTDSVTPSEKGCGYSSCTTHDGKRGGAGAIATFVHHSDGGDDESGGGDDDGDDGGDGGGGDDDFDEESDNEDDDGGDDDDDDTCAVIISHGESTRLKKKPVTSRSITANLMASLRLLPRNG